MLKLAGFRQKRSSPPQRKEPFLMYSHYRLSGVAPPVVLVMLSYLIPISETHSVNCRKSRGMEYLWLRFHLQVLSSRLR